MCQIYHANARTNVYVRGEILNSSLSPYKIAKRYNISTTTVYKWKKRKDLEDRPSVSKTVRYTLTQEQQAMVVALRKSTWLPLDEITEQFFADNPNRYRSAVYRTFKRHNVNRVPQEVKDRAKKFKEYHPGFLHVDVTYLPRINDKRYYLFVAIDRATRMLFYQVYQEKSSSNAKDFIKRCIDFYPFHITHILTDNGLEFTNRLLKSKKGKPTKKLSKVTRLCKAHNIKHRLTRPFTPKTNGMVEKANDLIKSNTVKIHSYTDLQEMNADLRSFLIKYNLYRRHGSLRKELNVRTPFDALVKWYELDKNLYKIHPAEIHAYFDNLPTFKVLNYKQLSET